MSRVCAIITLITSLLSASSLWANFQPQESATESRLSIFEASRQSVLKVEVELSGGTRAFGTGFFISEDGKAITNLHVLIGATKASALVGKDEIEYAIQPLTISVGYDLALFRVISKTKDEKFRAMVIRETKPRVGEEVWSMGFPRSLGYTLNQGVVSGVRVADVLKRDLKIDLGHAPGSTWIQTDCTINSGNSGGPLIDSNGHVVGVNTWAYTAADNTYFALAASHLKSITSYSGEPMGFKALAEMIRKTPVSHSRVPWLDLIRNINPDQLRKTTRTFRDKVDCISCKGSGEVQVKVQTGEQREGIYVRPIHSLQSRACSVCNGKKFSKDQTIKVGKQLVEHASRLNLKHKDAEKACDFIKTTIGDFTSDDLSKMGQIINEDAVEQFSDARQQLPIPVLFVGSIANEIAFGSDGKAVPMYLHGMTRRVMVLEPDVMKGGETDRALIGGMLSGKYRLASGELVDIVQGGFVVAGKK
jgi:hypothetical protein